MYSIQIGGCSGNPVIYVTWLKGLSVAQKLSNGTAFEARNSLKPLTTTNDYRNRKCSARPDLTLCTELVLYFTNYSTEFLLLLISDRAYLRLGNVCL